MDDGKLIDLVHSYPHLFDRKRSDFKDENSWAEIATLLKYSVSDVQSRWKYLREKYSRERNNMSPSGSGAPDKSPWPYLKSLMWLDAYMQKRRTKTNVNEESKAQYIETHSQSFFESQVQPLEIQTVTADDLDPELFSPSLSSEIGNQSDNEQGELSEPTTSDFSGRGSATPNTQDTLRVRRCNKRNSKGNDNAEVVVTMKDISSSMKSAVEVFRSQAPKRVVEKRTDDEDELFGRLIAARLAKMKDGKRKKALKKKLFADLMEMSDSE